MDMVSIVDNGHHNSLHTGQVGCIGVLSYEFGRSFNFFFVILFTGVHHFGVNSQGLERCDL